MAQTKTWMVTMQVVAPARMSAEKIETMIEHAVDFDVEIDRRNLDITCVRANEE